MAQLNDPEWLPSPIADAWPSIPFAKLTHAPCAPSLAKAAVVSSRGLGWKSSTRRWEMRASPLPRVPTH
ncbi:MAG: hypothetical protein SGI72_13355 [Planctomycetota bacterium]|nr:hypothetical protein [Planctomycetota bacterium]